MSAELRLTVVPTDPIPPDQLEELVLELKNDIEQSSNFGIPIRETQRKNEGTLGPEWLPVLTAVLAAPVALEIAKGLVVIITELMKRRKPVEITIDGSKGKYT